jgi:hypothetical protein
MVLIKRETKKDRRIHYPSIGVTYHIADLNNMVGLIPSVHLENNI